MFHAVRNSCGKSYLRHALFGELFTLAVLCCLSGASPARADLPYPQLSFIYPPGAKADGMTEVTIGGAELDEADRLIFSHPGIRATAKMAPATEFEQARLVDNNFSVEVGADVPPGIYEARIAGRFGLSNPRAFVVSRRAELLEAAGNNQKDKGMELPLGTVVNGRVDGANLDYYKLTLTAGQRTLIECAGHSIDSRIDPALVLFDGTGRELARQHNAARRDAVLDYVPTADGTYILGVYDFVYGGGTEHFYRLVAHHGPLVDFILPPSGVPGSTSQYAIYGRGLPGGQVVEGMVADGRPLERLDVTVTLPGDDSNLRKLAVPSAIPLSAAMQDSFEYRFTPDAAVPIYFAKAATVTEQEPNNAPANAHKITVPCEVGGQFYPNRDEDWFQFEAKKGDTFVIEVVSQRMGIYADPLLLVQRVTRNEKGEETTTAVAQVDDPGDRAGRIGTDFDMSTDDPTHRLQVNEDGVYRVMVRDHLGSTRKDPGIVYRLAIRKPQPDFRVVVTSEPVQAPANPALTPLGAISVRKGGTASLDVKVERIDGFNGDIEITAEGLPEGVTCSGALLGGDVSSAPLVFVASENAGKWAGTIRVVGRARVDGQDTIRIARSAQTIWGTANKQAQAAVFRMTRDLEFAVVAAETEAAIVQAGLGQEFVTSKGGTLSIPIKAVRRGDFKADLVLAPVGLPNEIKPQNVTIKGDQSEGQLAFAVTNTNAKPGLYTFVVRADTKVKHIRNPQAQADAEEEQKGVDAKVKEFTDATPKATQDKDAATQAAADATAALAAAQQAKADAETLAQQATQAAQTATDAAQAAKQQADTNAGNEELAAAAVAAEKARADAEALRVAAVEKATAATTELEKAQVAAKSAEEAKAAAEKLFAELDAKLKAAQQAKTAIDARLDAIKKANAPRDVDTAFISTPIKVRIVDTPIELNVAPPAAGVTQGQKIEIPLTLGRLYGFDGQVEVTLEAPKSVTGLQVTKVTVPKDLIAGKFELTAAENATVGDHTVTVRAKSQFNNVNVETVRTVVVKVVAK